MWKAEVKVMLKPGVLDPQGKAVAGGLSSLGFTGVESVRIGKYIELLLEAQTREEAIGQVEEMARRLLANPVIETFDFVVKSQEGGANS